MKWISWFKGLPLGWEPNINQIGLLVQVSRLSLGRKLQIHGVALHIAASTGSGSCIGIKNRDGNGHDNNDSSSNGNHI